MLQAEETARLHGYCLQSRKRREAHPLPVDKRDHLGVALKVSAAVDREDKQHSRAGLKGCVQLFLIVPLCSSPSEQQTLDSRSQAGARRAWSDLAVAAMTPGSCKMRTAGNIHALSTASLPGQALHSSAAQFTVHYESPHKCRCPSQPAILHDAVPRYLSVHECMAVIQQTTVCHGRSSGKCNPGEARAENWPGFEWFSLERAHQKTFPNGPLPSLLVCALKRRSGAWEK